MFCTQCGKPFQEDQRFCTACGTPAPAAPALKLRPVVPEHPAPPLWVPPAVAPPPAIAPPPAPAAPPIRPAGFWRRFFALAVDVPLLWGLLILLGIATTWLMNGAVERAVLDPEGRLLRQIITRYQIANLAASVILVWIYGAALEAGPLRATPGKWVLGIRLADRDGRRLTLWRATLRLLLKPLSAAPLLLGFVMAGLNRHKRALHDYLSGSYAVRR